jgi:hypothetical protein
MRLGRYAGKNMVASNIDLFGLSGLEKGVSGIGARVSGWKKIPFIQK